MLKILQFILSGCWHKWEHVALQPITMLGERVSTRVHTKCIKCNKRKWEDV